MCVCALNLTYSRTWEPLAACDFRIQLPEARSTGARGPRSGCLGCQEQANRRVEGGTAAPNACGCACGHSGDAHLVKRMRLVALNHPMPIFMFMSSLSLQFDRVRFTQGCDGVIVQQVFAMLAAHLSAGLCLSGQARGTSDEELSAMSARELKAAHLHSSPKIVLPLDLTNTIQLLTDLFH